MVYESKTKKPHHYLFNIVRKCFKTRTQVGLKKIPNFRKQITGMLKIVYILAILSRLPRQTMFLF